MTLFIPEFSLDVTDEELQEALEEDFEGIGCLKVVAALRTCHKYQWTVEWKCRGGDKKNMGFVDHTLTGYELEVKVDAVIKRNGGMLFGPLTGEFLQVAEETPQVR